MHKRNYTGPQRVRRALAKQEAKDPAERLTNFIIWMAYGWIITLGIFLRAAGWM